MAMTIVEVLFLMFFGFLCRGIWPDFDLTLYFVLLAFVNTVYNKWRKV